MEGDGDVNPPHLRVDHEDVMFFRKI